MFKVQGSDRVDPLFIYIGIPDSEKGVARTCAKGECTSPLQDGEDGRCDADP